MPVGGLIFVIVANSYRCTCNYCWLIIALYSSQFLWQGTFTVLNRQWLTIVMKGKPHLFYPHPALIIMVLHGNKNIIICWREQRCTQLACDACRPASSAVSQSAVCIQPCGTTDLPTSAFRPRHAASAWPSLVESAGESRLQAGRNCLLVPTWHGTAVSVL